MIKATILENWSRTMKTPGLKPREVAVLKAAHSAMMANVNAGLVYDVVKRAWVEAEGLTIKNAGKVRGI